MRLGAFSLVFLLFCSSNISAQWVWIEDTPPQNAIPNPGDLDNDKDDEPGAINTDGTPVEDLEDQAETTVYDRNGFWFEACRAGEFDTNIWVHAYDDSTETLTLRLSCLGWFNEETFEVETPHFLGSWIFNDETGETDELEILGEGVEVVRADGAYWFEVRVRYTDTPMPGEIFMDVLHPYASGVLEYSGFVHCGVTIGNSGSCGEDLADNSGYQTAKTDQSDGLQAESISSGFAASNGCSASSANAHPVVLILIGALFLALMYARNSDREISRG